ncbi:patatin-like phospholipase family protein [Aestuariirhabdus haliotis]|nr:patatin-like phospholipase family protein [Aestuariirhabdus haliotis]MCL6418494.1 patatin-like phospholipase family protein [Aestuariirhabdus haliotis]
MSSGFFSFYAHCGMACALYERGLKPVKITGSSAGALIGCCLSSDASPNRIRDFLIRLKPHQFWDPGWGLGLLKGQRFRSLVRDFTGIEQFSDCAIPLHLSAYHAKSGTTRILEDGDLSLAVQASCAVPFLMQPARIDGQWYWDGGIKDRHGLAATKPGERIFYHHISSRSPWRRTNSKALEIPQQSNLQALAIQGLPRCSPRNLSNGPIALKQAYIATLEALDHRWTGSACTI